MTTAATTYDAGRARRWLLDPIPTVDADSPSTVVEQLGIDHDWPGTGTDTRAGNVIALAHHALADEVIEVAATITDVDLINVVDAHAVFTGFRITVSDSTNREVIGPALLAEDLTEETTGTEGALAALANLADHIDKTAAQLAPMPLTTTDGHLYTAWTDGYAIGFHVTSPTGADELVYLNPSSETSDGTATVTLYRGRPGDLTDHHDALCHVDLLTTQCTECGYHIPDSTPDAVNDEHDTSCSLHPANITTPATDPQPPTITNQRTAIPDRDARP